MRAMLVGVKVTIMSEIILSFIVAAIVTIVAVMVSYIGGTK